MYRIYCQQLVALFLAPLLILSFRRYMRPPMKSTLPGSFHNYQACRTKMLLTREVGLHIFTTILEYKQKLLL